MFKHIRTSEENKEVVTKLTRKLSLGTENIIARVAIAKSLSQERKLDLLNILDSKGKEYAKNVLFGDHYEIYAGMVALKYGIHISNKNIPKYLKIHLDEGLLFFSELFEKERNIEVCDIINNLMSDEITNL